MKRIALSLLLVLPLLFVGCDKENNTTGNGTPSGNQQTSVVEFSFAKLNTWIGKDTTTIINELTSLGFTSGRPYGKNSTISYTLIDQATMMMIECDMTADDNGIVKSVQLSRFLSGQTTASNIALMKQLVSEERTLLQDELLVNSSGNIHITDNDNPSFVSWEELQTEMEKYVNNNDLGLNWYDVYTLHSAYVMLQNSVYEDLVSTAQTIALIANGSYQ